MLDSELVDALIVVNAGVAFATVEGACKSGGEFADKSMVGES